MSEQITIKPRGEGEMMFHITEVTENIENEVAAGNLIPAGEHNFVIEHARCAPNKKQTGEYIEITCILEGTSRKLWHYFNIKNEDKSVENRGKVDLKKLLIALRMEGLTTADELKEKLFSAEIEHVKDKMGKMQTKIVAFGQYKGPFDGQKSDTKEDDVPF